MKTSNPIRFATLLVPLCITAWCATAPHAAATTVLSNLGQPVASFGWVFDYADDYAAIEFTTDNQGPWNLTAANLDFAVGSLDPDAPIRVRIAADAGGTPGSVLGSALQNAPTSPSIVSFPLSGIVLAANTSYWLEAALDAGNYGVLGSQWRSLNPTSTTADGLSLWTIQGFAGSPDGGANWFSLDQMMAFSLEASVPEPGSIALFGCGVPGLAGMAWRRRARRRRWSPG